MVPTVSIAPILKGGYNSDLDMHVEFASYQVDTGLPIYYLTDVSRRDKTKQLKTYRLAVQTRCGGLSIGPTRRW